MQTHRQRVDEREEGEVERWRGGGDDTVGSCVKRARARPPPRTPTRPRGHTATRPQGHAPRRFDMR
eukprot:6173843-Pleurochrysis_carterae.AAC.1